MKTKIKIFLACAVLMMQSQQVMSQADCNTAAGVLALMVAKVVVGTPSDPATLPAASNLPFSITSELFKVAQNESSNSTCYPKVTYKLYTSTSSTALDNLPSLASANANFVPATNILVSTMTKTRSGNVITATGSRTRTNYPTFKSGKGGIPVRNTVYYRIAKRITNCSSCSGQDPYVFSPEYSFLVPNEPAVVVVPKKSDLLPRPTANSNVNRPLFKNTGASHGANNETFLRLPNEFCQGLGTGTQVATYNCGLNLTCKELKHSVPLGPVVYAARNGGDTTSGTFTVTLHRKDKVGSNATSVLTQVASSQVPALAVNAQSANFSFNPNKTVDIYTFPDDNPGSCFVRCDPNQGGCVVPYQEEEYMVKVDGGNNVFNGGTVQEKSETNNEGNPMD
ncbi:MAG: hypothetical protein IPN36_12150 [Bacteroidetes bacterium]|nr:hypothetical protein [Bacteroidota bacterium]